MTRGLGWLVSLAVLVAATAFPVLAAAQDAGQIKDVGQVKVVKGTVHVERGGQRQPASVGLTVREGDVIVTGPGSSVGLLFLDASLLSAGPDSRLAIDRFAFDSTTNQGAFDTSLRAGTLAVVSGKIAKQAPGAMRVKTPAAILGARGTEFVVRATGSAD
jgi:hypothetical protein